MICLGDGVGEAADGAAGGVHGQAEDHSAIYRHGRGQAGSSAEEHAGGSSAHTHGACGQIHGTGTLDTGIGHIRGIGLTHGLGTGTGAYTRPTRIHGAYTPIHTQPIRGTLDTGKIGEKKHGMAKKTILEMGRLGRLGMGLPASLQLSTAISASASTSATILWLSTNGAAMGSASNDAGAGTPATRRIQEGA